VSTIEEDEARAAWGAFDDCDPDFSIAGMERRDPPAPPRDAWLLRRMSAWGASEMPMILAATGRRALEALPRWMAQRVRVTRQSFGQPRIYAEKAGLLAPLAAGPAARIGQEREIELMQAWTMALDREEYAIPIEAVIDTASIRHASEVPVEWMPLRARACDHIAATPDGWCRSEFRDLYDAELKCVTSDCFEARWYWVTQVQAQGMCTGSAGAFLIAGSRWARATKDRGPIVRCFIEPDEHMRRELAEAADEAWEHVAKLKREHGNADA
jgi:hypothetical protein